MVPDLDYDKVLNACDKVPPGLRVVDVLGETMGVIRWSDLLLVDHAGGPRILL